MMRFNVKKSKKEHTMKNFFRTILSLMLTVAIAVSTSGCINTGPIATEKHKQLMLSLLKEKYGEEFKVLTIKYDSSSGFSGGLAPGSGHYDAVCCPKSNEEILFEASVCKNGTMISSDDYPQAVIEKKAKDIAEEIVSKCTDNFIVYTYVSAPFKTVSTDDSTWEKVKNAKPYTSAEEITIENYVDKYFETSDLSMDIILLNDMVENAKQRNEMLEKLSLQLKGLSSLVDIYYTDSETMQECKKYIDNNKYDTRLILDTIINDKGFCYVYYQRQETDYKWVFNESSSVISYE